jgi:hypothetical protein
MKRLDINVTDTLQEVLEQLKASTERSKTELVHDAIGLLWLAQKTYDDGHALGEVNPTTGEVISVFRMPMFETPKVLKKEEAQMLEDILLSKVE